MSPETNARISFSAMANDTAWFFILHPACLMRNPHSGLSVLSFQDAAELILMEFCADLCICAREGLSVAFFTLPFGLRTTGSGFIPLPAPSLCRITLLHGQQTLRSYLSLGVSAGRFFIMNLPNTRSITWVICS